MTPATLLGSPVQDLAPTSVIAPSTETLRPRGSFWPGQSQNPKTFRRGLPQWTRTLNQLGGVQAREQGSPTLSIRGSSQAGRTLGVWNGVPLNFSTGFGIPNLFVPREIIGAVQILKGPASQYYGSQAMGGALLLGPQWSESPELGFGLSDTNGSFLPWEAGHLGNYNISVVLPVIREKTSKTQLSLFNEYNDGHFPFTIDNGPVQMRTDNRQGLVRATYVGEHKWKRSQLKYNLLVGYENRDTPGSLLLPGKTDQESIGLIANINPRWDFTPHFSLVSNTSFLLLNNDFKFGGDTSFFHQDTLIQQTQLQWIFNRWQIHLFVDGFFHGLESSFYDERRLTENRLELGPHTFFQWAPSWFSTLSSRLLAGQGRWLNSVSTNFKRRNHWTWFTYSEGFRAGTLSDRFGSSPFSTPNPGLKPEQSTQLELGYKFTHDNPKATTYAWRWGFEAQLFRTLWRDFFETQIDERGRFQKVNRTGGDSAGGEVQLWARWGPWALRFNYNHLRTRNSGGQTFLFSPTHQWTWVVKHFIGPFHLQLDYQSWSDFYDQDLQQNRVRLPDWSQWNISFGSYAFRQLNFVVGVENIFNTPRQLTLGYPEPQRRYWLHMRYKF